MTTDLPPMERDGSRSEIGPPLEHCPHCGRVQRRTIDGQETDGPTYQPGVHGGTSYRVNCTRCGASSGNASSPEAAAEKWNRRPHAPPTPADTADIGACILLLRGSGPFAQIEAVAEGFITSDGRAVLAWLGNHRSVAVYPTVRDMYEVHRGPGHSDTWIVNASRDAEIAPDPWHPSSIISALVDQGRSPAGIDRVGEPVRLRWVDLDWVGNAIGVGEYLEEWMPWTCECGADVLMGNRCPYRDEPGHGEAPSE